MLTRHLKHTAQVALPRETPAFFRAACGAVSLDPNRVCKVQGRGTKADRCGIPDNNPPRQCANRTNNIRRAGDTCGKLAVNAELLCEPREMPAP